MQSCTLKYKTKYVFLCTGFMFNSKRSNEINCKTSKWRWQNDINAINCQFDICYRWQLEVGECVVLFTWFYVVVANNKIQFVGFMLSRVSQSFKFMHAFLLLLLRWSSRNNRILIFGKSPNSVRRMTCSDSKWNADCFVITFSLICGCKMATSSLEYRTIVQCQTAFGFSSETNRNVEIAWRHIRYCNALRVIQ